MNEYWQADTYASFCFCSAGEWYQLLENEGVWELNGPLPLDRGLPSDMHAHYYSEIDLPTMLTACGWDEGRLQSQIQTTTDRVAGS